MKKLFAVGTGPGDPELLTIKSVHLIESADVIFAPDNRGKNMALDSAREYIKTDRIVYLSFPMGKMNDDLYKKNVNIIKDNLRDGEIGVYLTIGDASIYSTFMNILKYEPDFNFEISSGIPSFLEAANIAKVPLATTGKNFTLVDNIDGVNLEFVDRIAILKTFKDKSRTLDMLEAHGFKYVYIEEASSENELVLTNRDEILKRAGYMSLIIGWKE